MHSNKAIKLIMAYITFIKINMIFYIYVIMYKYVCIVYIHFKLNKFANNILNDIFYKVNHFVICECYK